MHTLIVCRKRGYTIEHLTSDQSITQFHAVIIEGSTTTAALYDAEGAQVNAYFCPEQFPHHRHPA